MHSVNTASSSFDKHAAYALAVQSPADDARFLRALYRNINGTEPSTLREDFCGTFSLCCEWAKLDESKRALGLDIDPDPLEYGERHYRSLLSDSIRRRVTTYKRDVLAGVPTKADIICALNFSYFSFHSRKTLLRYFTRCKRSLHLSGL